MISHFYCPEILKLTAGQPFEKLKREGRIHLHADGSILDCGGHGTAAYHWDERSHSITHPNNGIPVCSLCGKTMEFVAGDTPI